MKNILLTNIIKYYIYPKISLSMLPKPFSTAIDQLKKEFMNFSTLSLRGILGLFTLFLLNSISLVRLLGTM
jgi:hypothetical protein